MTVSIEGFVSAVFEVLCYHVYTAITLSSCFNIVLCLLQISSVQFLESLLILFSYVVASGSEITPCNKIDKPLVVYIFSGNVMTSITTLRT